MMLIDTHCHLASRHFSEMPKEDVIGRARQMGIGRMVTLGSCFDDWAATLAWAREFPSTVDACLGIHPNDAHETPACWREELVRLASSNSLAAIGEAGLDYYHPSPEGYDDRQFRKLQQSLLEEHFELAAELGLNIVLHTRDRKGTDSFDDTLEIARRHAGRVRPVFHCFIGTRDQALRIFGELDGLISITGIATFKNPGHVADVVSWCPDDRFMLETDSPYLSPEPKRGKPNEPAYLSYLAQCVAGLREISLESLAGKTMETASRFFRLVPAPEN